MPAVSRPQLLLYAALSLVIVLLGARALRADGSAGAPAPEAVVEGSGAGEAPDGVGPAPAAQAPPPAGAPPGTGAEAGVGPDAAKGPATSAAGVGGAGTPGGTGPGGPEILVHVAGAVRRPGVYRMPAGARVEDAVTSAGGPRRGADVHRLNLAAKVVDGAQILIPRRGQRASVAGQAPGPAAASPPAGGSTAAPSTTEAGAVPGSGERIDLNSATIEQLETLHGVGPAIAQKIVDWREANGGFRSVDDLAQVSGIGPKKLEAMRPRVGV